MDQTIEHAPKLLAARGLAALLTPLSLLLTDVTVTGCALFSTLYLREQLLPGFFGLEQFNPVRNYLSLWPALMLLLVIRSVYGLYPGYGLNPAEELRRQTIGTSLVAFFVLAGGTLFRFSADYSRLVILITGLSLVVLLPIARSVIKSLLSRLPFYGEGIWIVSKTDRGRDISRTLIDNPALGLKVIGHSQAEPAQEVYCQHCLVIPDEIPDISRTLDKLNSRFRRVWLVPNLLDVSSVWVTPRDLRGHLALELRNNLLEPTNRFVKRCIDLIGLLLLLPIVTPLLLLSPSRHLP